MGERIRESFTDRERETLATTWILFELCSVRRRRLCVCVYNNKIALQNRIADRGKTKRTRNRKKIKYIIRIQLSSIHLATINGIGKTHSMLQINWIRCLLLLLLLLLLLFCRRNYPQQKQPEPLTKICSFNFVECLAFYEEKKQEESEAVTKAAKRGDKWKGKWMNTMNRFIGNIIQPRQNTRRMWRRIKNAKKAQHNDNTTTATKYVCIHKNARATSENATRA